MGYIKQISLACLLVASFCTAPTHALADGDLDSISQNCTSIKQSLTHLQRADSRTRTYLGSSYEIISSNFITPLNVRLIKNNRPDTSIFTVQSKFTDSFAKFRTAYTDYMRELESLISVDCQSNPQEFYDRLESTRNHRSILHDLTATLSELIGEQYRSVLNLKGSL